MKLGQGSDHGWMQQENHASNTRHIHSGSKAALIESLRIGVFPSILKFMQGTKLQRE